MQSVAGTLPPLRPVPLPRVTPGVPVSLASFNTELTSSVVAANKTHPGVCFIAAVPSNAYGIKSSFSVSTFTAPTMERNFSKMVSPSAIARHDAKNAPPSQARLCPCDSPAPGK